MAEVDGHVAAGQRTGIVSAEERVRTSTSKTQEYVSVIGFSYLYPISTLLEVLDSLPPRGQNEVQASSVENGYSVSVAVLTVLLIESAVGRTQCVMERTAERHPLDFVRKAFPACRVIDGLEELFVVRDVIVHNHMWVAEIAFDEEHGMKLVEAKLRENYGNPRFDRVADQQSRTTRQLGLNIFPTRIGRRDAAVVLGTAVEFLLFLERQDRRYFYISPQNVRFHEEYMPFTEMVRAFSERYA